MNPDPYRLIGEKLGAGLRTEVPASVLTTYKAGGPLEAVAVPATREKLAWLRVFCRENGLPFRVLGAGSNVLVSDKGLKGVTVLTQAFSAIRTVGNTLYAGAGALWDDAVKAAVEAGLAGIEKTSGIPGTVGGAVFMNAGAFGQEAFDRLDSVEVLDGAGAFRTMKKSAFRHGYRRVEGLEGLVVLDAAFILEPADKAALSSDRACVLARRAEKQPLDLPSAGSVFKRPEGDFASRLIDAAGLKGLRVGDAQVSEKHAGFIVNLGRASASDIRALMQKVRAAVKASSGVDLELEQILLGDFD
ncbi:MAG TPA: UDP-N-acetylmuramate dehydrogenase [Elusimicrobiales bacterium]|nr:UDP-N-acetylmuramate dehydrogenase [Elusimicrobiales bacterium]